MLIITAFSWFILGLWYGFGYCFCTDWHYQVKMKLGHTDMPPSYVKFLIDSLTGLDMDDKMMDIATFTFFFLALVASIFTNMKDWRNRENL